MLHIATRIGAMQVTETRRSQLPVTPQKKQKHKRQHGFAAVFTWIGNWTRADRNKKGNNRPNKKTNLSMLWAPSEGQCTCGRARPWACARRSESRRPLRPPPSRLESPSPHQPQGEGITANGNTKCRRFQTQPHCVSFRCKARKFGERMILVGVCFGDWGHDCWCFASDWWWAEEGKKRAPPSPAGQPAEEDWLRAFDERGTGSRSPSGESMSLFWLSSPQLRCCPHPRSPNMIMGHQVPSQPNQALVHGTYYANCVR